MLTDIVLLIVLGSTLPVVLAPLPFSALLWVRYTSGETAPGWTPVTMDTAHERG